MEWTKYNEIKLNRGKSKSINFTNNKIDTTVVYLNEVNVKYGDSTQISYHM